MSRMSKQKALLKDITVEEFIELLKRIVGEEDNDKYSHNPCRQDCNPYNGCNLDGCPYAEMFWTL